MSSSPVTQGSISSLHGRRLCIEWTDTKSPTEIYTTDPELEEVIGAHIRRFNLIKITEVSSHVTSATYINNININNTIIIIVFFIIFLSSF
jgi:hypothetical protein